MSTTIEPEGKTTPKKSRVRSPGYPMIDLKEAIEKVMILWDKDKTNPIPKDVAAKHMGYGAAGGHVGRVIAALKHFDLISIKDGDIILNEKAVDLALHSPDDEEYQAIVRASALAPRVYADIFNAFEGGDVSDPTLKAKLIKDYGFNPRKVDGFIKDYRSTIAFAGLTEAIGPEQEEELDVKERSHMGEHGAPPVIRSRPSKGSTAVAIGQSFPIPLSKGKKAAINFESLPVEMKDIEVIKSWLELFADSLTESENNDEKASQVEDANE